jgi:hypothetical protein
MDVTEFYEEESIIPGKVPICFDKLHMVILLVFTYLDVDGDLMFK